MVVIFISFHDYLTVSEIGIFLLIGRYWFTNNKHLNGLIFVCVALCFYFYSSMQALRRMGSIT